jgi:hypothetical protein
MSAPNIKRGWVPVVLLDHGYRGLPDGVVYEDQSRAFDAARRACQEDRDAVGFSVIPAGGVGRPMAGGRGGRVFSD